MRQIGPELAARITAVLTDFSRINSRYPLDAEVFSYLSTYCVSGKLFRGSLFLAMCELLKKENEFTLDRLMPVAVALELYGSGILIQDDVMDQDGLRRGNKTVHTWLVEYAQKHSIRDAQRWGESVATCFADTLFFVAGECLTTAQLDQSHVQKLQTYSFRELALLGMAQAEDLRQAGAPGIPSHQEILDMFVGKTGRYTARWPLALAGLVSDVTPEIQHALEAVGESIGVVYQMRDDYLGLFGDAQVTGKNTTSDIREGKKTLYAATFFACARGEMKERAQRIFASKNASEQDCAWFKEALTTTGSSKEVDVLLEQYVAEILTQIDQLELPMAVKSLLKGIAMYSARRDK